MVSYLERLMADQGWKIFTAEIAAEASRVFQEHLPDLALLDYNLPDGNGLELGVEFVGTLAEMSVILMSGTILSPEDEAVCEEHHFPILRKPFLASDVMNQVRSRLGSSSKVNIAFTARALKAFFCYSHRDEKLRDRLDAQLSVLKHMNIIHSWHDRKIRYFGVD